LTSDEPLATKVLSCPGFRNRKQIPGSGLIVVVAERPRAGGTGGVEIDRRLAVAGKLFAGDVIELP